MNESSYQNKKSDKSSILDFLSKDDKKTKESAGAKIESDDISLSELEVMANKKKIKKHSEKSLSEVNPVPDPKEKTDVSSSDNPVTKRSTSSDSIDEKRQRRKEKAVKKENKDDAIRKEKSELLYKFSKVNIKGKWSSLKLDMNNSLDEIKNEYERVRSEIQNERSVAFFKRMLLLGVQGIEMMNTRFDPVGVDLEGWSEAMGYSLENQEYDEVLAELYEKYKGSGNMSPEVKLIFMIISSATMFTISKKISAMDSSNGFMNFIGNMLGSKSGQDQQQQQHQQFQQQQMYQQQQQQMYQQQQHQHNQHNHNHNHNHNHQQVRIPSPNELRNAKSEATMTETSEDQIPSKLQGPVSNVINNDGIDIDNILKTMNERKKEKTMAVESAEEDVTRSIPMTAQKRGRGRPRKQAAAVSR